MLFQERTHNTTLIGNSLHLSQGLHVISAEPLEALDLMLFLIVCYSFFHLAASPEAMLCSLLAHLGALAGCVTWGFPVTLGVSAWCL